jgi:hypothetical protein
MRSLMRLGESRRVLAVAVAVVAVAVGLGFSATASADPGQSQTFHFNSISGQLGTPAAPITNVSNCPAPVINDFTSIDATGNGISHQTINGKGDGWFTSTFTGTATVTFYPDGTVDDQGNVTSVGGTPDMQVTGHLTNWFGGSFNAQNSVVHGTINFQGTEVFPNPGAPIRFHDTTHVAWLPGVDQNGPPSFFFNVANC